MMIAQHQTEAPSRPSITSLTTKCADQNMPSSVASANRAREVGIGKIGRIHLKVVLRKMAAALERKNCPYPKIRHLWGSQAGPPAQTRAIELSSQQG